MSSSTSTYTAIILITALLICTCLAYVAGFGAYQLWYTPESSQSTEPFDVFWEVWDRIVEHFYGELPSPQERTYGAVREALLLLNDPYTIFVEPQPRELERDRMRGAFGGIGVVLWHDTKGQMTLSPHSGSPAEDAGLCEGDVLLQVNGEALTNDTTIDDVRAWLHGEVGTPVTLTISRPPTPPFDVTITRAQIQVPSVVWRVIDHAPDIGYIRIESFTERTGDEVAKAIQGLMQKDQVTSLILDLRNNSGGLLDASVATASQFLRDGTILTEQYRDNRTRVFSVQAKGAAAEIPLAILVNGGTASASEIVAGALQDHSRGPLIGEPTFGKGSVQLIYDLSDSSSLHVTSAIWLTPNQHQLEGHGLTPNIHILPGEGQQDEQLNRAVSHLQSQ